MKIADLANLGFLPLRSEERSINLGSRVGLYAFRTAGAPESATVDSRQPSVGTLEGGIIWRSNTGKRPLHMWSIGAIAAQVATPSRTLTSPAGSSGGGRRANARQQPKKIEVGGVEQDNPFAAAEQQVDSVNGGWFGSGSGGGFFGINYNGQDMRHLLGQVLVNGRPMDFGIFGQADPSTIGQIQITDPEGNVWDPFGGVLGNVGNATQLGRLVITPPGGKSEASSDVPAPAGTSLNKRLKILDVNEKSPADIVAEEARKAAGGVGGQGGAGGSGGVQGGAGGSSQAQRGLDAMPAGGDDSEGGWAGSGASVPSLEGKEDFTAMTFLPTSGGGGVADERYLDKLGAMPKWASRLPGGWKGIMTPGSSENAQHDLFHPAFHGLVASDLSEAYGLSTALVDLKSDGTVDPERRATLERFWKVVLNPLGININEIAWNWLGGGWTSAPKQEITETTERNSRTGKRPPLNIGYMHQLAWAPFVLPDDDIHKLSTDVDGNQVGPVHFASSGCWWKNKDQDGPLFFEGFTAPEVGGSTTVPAHIVYDRAMKKWRIQAESFQDDDRRTPPPPPPPPPTTPPTTPVPTTPTTPPTTPTTPTSVQEEEWWKLSPVDAWGNPIVPGGWKGAPAGGGGFDNPWGIPFVPIPGLSGHPGEGPGGWGPAGEDRRWGPTIAPTIDRPNSRPLVQSYREQAVPGLVYKPGSFGCGSLDLRNAQGPVGRLADEQRNRAPVVGRVEAAWKKGEIGQTGCNRDEPKYTQQPGSSRYKAGTASGVVAYFPGEVGLEDFAGVTTLAPSVRAYVPSAIPLSTVHHVALRGYVWWGSGYPDPTTGLPRDGWYWGASKGSDTKMHFYGTDAAGNVIADVTIPKVDAELGDVSSRLWLHGFEFANGVHTQCDIFYDPVGRILRIVPITGDGVWWVWWKGNKIKFTGTQYFPALPLTNGVYSYRITSTGALVVNTTDCNDEEEVRVGAVTVQTASTPQSFAYDLRYPVGKNVLTTLFERDVIGATVTAGCNLTGLALNSVVQADINYGLTSGELAVMELRKLIPGYGLPHNIPDGGPYTTMYRSGAAGNWIWSITTPNPYYYDVAADRIQKNIFDGTNWILSPVASKRFVNYYIIACMAIKNDGSAENDFSAIIIPSQFDYATLLEAQGESLASLSLGGVTLRYSGPIWQVTFYCTQNYTSIGSVVIAAVAKINNQRAQLSAGTAAGNHEALSGLQDAGGGAHSHLSATQSARAAEPDAASNAAKLAFRGGSLAANPPATEGAIRYNEATDKMQQFTHAAGWVDISTGGGSAPPFDHNTELTGLQGGGAAERYHMTAADATKLAGLGTDATYEKVANRGALYGYASLTGGVVDQNPSSATEIAQQYRIPIANAAGVLNKEWIDNAGIDHNSTTGLQGGSAAERYHISIADATKLAGLQSDAAYEKVANKGVASGYPSLDGNIKVAQNPASATATPTPNAIPIADTNGKLDAWVTPSSGEKVGIHFGSVLCKQPGVVYYLAPKYYYPTGPGPSIMVFRWQDNSPNVRLWYDPTLENYQSADGYTDLNIWADGGNGPVFAVPLPAGKYIKVEASENRAEPAMFSVEEIPILSKSSYLARTITLGHDSTAALTRWSFSYNGVVWWFATMQGSYQGNASVFPVTIQYDGGGGVERGGYLCWAQTRSQNQNSSLTLYNMFRATPTGGLETNRPIGGASNQDGRLLVRPLTDMAVGSDAYIAGPPMPMGYRIQCNHNNWNTAIHSFIMAFTTELEKGIII